MRRRGAEERNLPVGAEVAVDENMRACRHRHRGDLRLREGEREEVEAKQS
jgi:hypothetical protein